MTNFPALAAICFLLTFVQIYSFLIITSCPYCPFPSKTALVDAVNSFSIISFMIATVITAIFFLLNAGTLILSKLILFCSLSLFFIYHIRFPGSLSYYFISLLFINHMIINIYLQNLLAPYYCLSLFFIITSFVFIFLFFSYLHSTLLNIKKGKKSVMALLMLL